MFDLGRTSRNLTNDVSRLTFLALGAAKQGMPPGHTRVATAKQCLIERNVAVSICFSLAQFPLRTPTMQVNALSDFNFNKKLFDLGGDASRGAVWKAGAKGLEPLMSPSLTRKGCPVPGGHALRAVPDLRIRH